ncbi:MAG: transposase [Thermoleophilia bacterium]|nr:transposase [Thermoleophilia bacterium]
MAGYQGRTSRGIRVRTVEEYRRDLEREAIPYLGHLRLTEIQPRHIKAFAAELSGRGLSIGTVRDAITPVRALMATAVEEGLIRANPCAGQEGLMALSVGVGLGVLAELMEEEVIQVVGPKGRHDPDRSAVRHGHGGGEVTLGGRRVPIQRPRVRAVDGSGKVGLETYQHFADRDPLARIVLERMLTGVSCRRYGRTQEVVGTGVEDAARGTSKSAISRTFIERTRIALAELMARRLEDVRLAVLMLDGIDLNDRTHIVALGITTEGVKIPLGLWEGSTENTVVATALLADLVEHGLDPTQGILFVLDSGDGPQEGSSGRCSATTRWCSGVSATKNATCWGTCRSVTGP